MGLAILQLYRNAFGGLSKAAWMLALTMLINRSGSMVLPFLGVYLSDALNFSLSQTGWIMTLYGLGSIGGAFLGGWLTDKIGHFLVQFLSLFIGGLVLFVLAGITVFETLAVGIFVFSLIIESLRPANASSVSYYARPENVTRAFSLNRMALNLGFSIGPAAAGLLAGISYVWLFYADGVTCISAAILFFLYFKNKPGSKAAPVHTDHPIKGKSPYKDVPYVWFVVLSSIFAILFFQLIFTLPIYYREVYMMPEWKIGLLLGLNGMVVFLLEMVIVYKVGQRLALWKLVSLGMLLLGLSFSILNFGYGLPLLLIAMILLSLSEILVMPFLATVVVQRSGLENRGAYMGLYTVSSSAGFVLAPLIGTQIIDRLGFNELWWVVGFFSILVSAGFYLSLRGMKN